MYLRSVVVMLMSLIYLRYQEIETNYDEMFTCTYLQVELTMTSLYSASLLYLFLPAKYTNY